MLKTRNIPTFSEVMWKPFLASKPVHIPSTKLNTFQGFALESVPGNDIDFQKTTLFDLLQRLCDRRKEHVDYLLMFLASKLQRPWIKHPIALVWLNALEGVGKTSLGIFLKKLFACGPNSFVSFNSLMMVLSEGPTRLSKQ